MLDALRQFWDQESSNQRNYALLDAIFSASTHGIALAFDPLWLEYVFFQLLHEGRGRTDIEPFWPWYPERYWRHNWRVFPQGLWEQRLLFRADLLYRYALFQDVAPSRFLKEHPRPKFWAEYCYFRGLPENTAPIRIYVDVIPQSDYSEANLRVRGLQREYRNSEVLMSLANCPIFFRHREIASLSYLWNPVVAARGVRIQGEGGYGSVGGILRSAQNGEFYIVTCAHVVGGARQVKLTAWPHLLWRCREVGQIRYASALTHLKDAPEIEVDALTHPLASPLDACAVQIPESLTTRQTRTPRFMAPDSICTGQRVSFQGARTGLGRGLVEWERPVKSFRLAKDMYVIMKNLIEIKQAPPAYIRRPVARKGDSGSWIYFDVDGAWAGMIVGADGDRAYCCRARDIWEQLQLTLGPLEFA